MINPSLCPLSFLNMKMKADTIRAHFCVRPNLSNFGARPYIISLALASVADAVFRPQGRIQGLPAGLNKFEVQIRSPQEELGDRGFDTASTAMGFTRLDGDDFKRRIMITVAQYTGKWD